MEKTIEIPEGYEARIEGNKIILEPKESEDEKIRKALMQNLKERFGTKGNMGEGLDMPDVLTWLEKQGSQNLANSAKTCKIEQKPTLPGFEEQEGVAGRDYIPVEWVDAIENYGKWKIVRVNEQNPAWSEADENRLKVVISFVNSNPAEDPFYDKGCLKDWLKSLKERYTWKPSDEQMRALDGVISSRDVKYNVLSELWKDLKKLKG